MTSGRRPRRASAVPGVVGAAGAVVAAATTAGGEAIRAAPVTEARPASRVRREVMATVPTGPGRRAGRRAVNGARRPGEGQDRSDPSLPPRWGAVGRSGGFGEGPAVRADAGPGPAERAGPAWPGQGRTVDAHEGAHCVGLSHQL